MSEAPPPEAAEVVLAKLRDRYRATSGKTIAIFSALAEQVARTPDASEVLETLRKELHRVRGTAGTYGFADASDVAGLLEPRVIKWMSEPAMERDRRADLVRNFAAALARSFGTPDAPHEGVGTALRRLGLIDVPIALANALVREGPLQGYYVRHLTVAEWPALVADGEAPHIVVTPLSSLEDVRGIASAVNVPIIALEPDGDGRRVRGVHRPYDGVVVMAAGEDPGMLFEVADHAAQRSTPGGATLLVVDDDRDMLALVRAVMEPEGLRVVTLGDPARLLETIENTHPSLLLMDVSMDSFDGIALTRGLRDDPRWRELPIILFSSETDAERRRMAYAALADDFVPKPVVPEELRRRLRARLEQVRLRRLGEGLHPGTGLPLAARTAREAARTIELAGAAPIAIALVRPRGVLPRGAAADAWMHEAERLARLLGRADIGTVGLTNDDGLLVVTTADVGVLDVALRNAADDRLPNVPVWTAGLASSSDVRRSLDALQQAAEEALAAADGQPVHRWSPDDDALAPDVVVVEDDEALSDMLQYALRAAGFTFRAYTSGTAALEGLLRLRPGTKRVLVLLDVDLPGLDGHSLHERLRVERPDHFAVVFATAHASEAEQLRALHAGAIDYVMKPIALRVLMAKVRIWIARAEQRGS